MLIVSSAQSNTNFNIVYLCFKYSKLRLLCVLYRVFRRERVFWTLRLVYQGENGKVGKKL